MLTPIGSTLLLVRLEDGPIPLRGIGGDSTLLYNVLQRSPQLFELRSVASFINITAYGCQTYFVSSEAKLSILKTTYKKTYIFN